MLLEMDTHLAFLEKNMEEVAGAWNGDEPAGEERAMCAKDIVEKSQELRALLEEMQEYV